jgi:hypothetical protein
MYSGCASQNTHTPPSLIAPGDLSEDREYKTEYTYAYKLIEPAQIDLLEYRDDLLFCRLIPDQNTIGVDIYNLSSDPFYVDWNQIRMIDAEGLSQGVFRRLELLSDGVREQDLSLILPQGVLSDTLTPKNKVYRNMTGWAQKPLFPNSAEALSMKGQTFGLVIPVKQEESVKTYRFTFEVSDVQSYLVEIK